MFTHSKGDRSLSVAAGVLAIMFAMVERVFLVGVSLGTR
jgi:hypothetical protein